LLIFQHVFIRIVLIQPFYQRFMRGLDGNSGLGLMLGGGGGARADGSIGLRQKGAILNTKAVFSGVASMLKGVTPSVSSRQPKPSLVPPSKGRALMAGGMDQCKAAFVEVNLARRPSGYLTQV
jgi:hypothetical protein